MSERSRIIDLLRSDLYESVTLNPGTQEAEELMVWQSPGGWRVTIQGDRHHPIVSVHRPDGSEYLSPSPMTAYALDGILP